MKDIQPDHNRTSKRKAERADAPVNSELECRATERQSNKQRGGVLASCHVILLQEAESHFHEIAEISAEQFHQGADQHRNTFEPDVVNTEDVIPGTSKQDSFGLDGKVDVQEDTQARKLYVHTRLYPLEQHDREEARN